LEEKALPLDKAYQDASTHTSIHRNTPAAIILNV